MNNVATSFVYMYVRVRVCVHVVLIFLGIYQGVEFLSYMMTLCCTF